MFGLFKKNQTSASRGIKSVFHIDGMHCSSCAMNIDGALEDLEGVFSAHTKYAQGTTEVDYDDTKLSNDQLIEVIEAQGYKVKV